MTFAGQVIIKGLRSEVKAGKSELVFRIFKVIIRFGKVINAEMGTEVGEIVGMSKAINCVDMKPTRPFRLVTGSEDFTATFFEGPPFKFTKSLRDHTNFVQCCKFSPKGDIMVTGGSDGKLFAYDATTGDMVSEIGSPAHKGGIYGIDFSPSGERLISVSADKKIKLWSSTKPFNLLSDYSFEDKLENMQVRLCFSRSYNLLFEDLETWFH